MPSFYSSCAALRTSLSVGGNSHWACLTRWQSHVGNCAVVFAHVMTDSLILRLCSN